MLLRSAADTRSLLAARAARPLWVVAVLLGLLASIPALRVGFANDDLIQRLWLEGRLREVPVTRLSLYDFSGTGLSRQRLVDLGVYPWFAERDLSLRFLRPLSSATLALDDALFGRDPVLAHVHSLFWLGVLVGLAAALYARWLERRTARLAALIYAIAGIHAVPTAWLAARHTLVAATFGLAALWAWARFREEHWRLGRVLAFGFAVAGLLSSESALVGLLLLVMYEWGTQTGYRARLRASVGFVVLGLGYLATYAALGYGTSGSGIYVSPLSAPGKYAWLMLSRVPIAWSELFGAAPSWFSGGLPGARPILVTWGLAALALGLVTLWLGRARIGVEERAVLTWLGLAAVLAPTLLVGAFVSGRLLPLPLLGAAAVVARVLVLCWETVRDASGKRRWLALVPLGLLGFLHFVVAPSVRVALTLAWGSFGDREQKVAEQVDVGTCTDAGVLYLLTGADPALFLYLTPAVLFYTPDKTRAKRLRVLSMAPQDQRLARVSARSFELEVLGKPRRINAFEWLFRSSPLEPNQSFVAEELRARVLETSAGLATRVHFDLDTSLDSPSVCLLSWKDGRVQPVRPPRVGQSLLVPHEPGPFGL